MPVNLVVADGVVKSPALRYGDDGKPEFRWTLQQEENGFRLFLPCCALGSAAERLAEQINEGDHIVITSGRLTYRKRSTKLGEQSRLEILAWSVETLPTLPQVARSADAEDGTAHEPEHRPEPKVRRRGYPRQALQGGFATNAT
jgi:single-stranded DNA-binding protein